MKTKVLLILTMVVFCLGGVSIAAAKATAAAQNSGKTNTACVQSAAEKRENAIIAAYTKKTDAIKSALETRKTALKEAWGKSTVRERVQARAQAWKTFKATEVKARLTYNQELKAAWATFNKERKACKITETNDENGATDTGL